MIELLQNIYAIEVPMTAKNVGILDFGEGVMLAWDCANMFDKIDLAPGNYEFICASLTVKEEEAAKIVAEKEWIGGFGWRYKNYMDNVVEVHEREGCFKMPIESLHSLLRSKGLDTKLNYAIIKKLP